MTACPPLPRTTWRTPRLEDEARAARAELEHALEGAGWPWASRLSLRLDGLLILESAPTLPEELAP